LTENCSFDNHKFPKLILGIDGMIELKNFEEGKMTAMITFVNGATFKSSIIEFFTVFLEYEK
jgi:hypothetical protein